MVERARNPDPLALPTRQPYTAFADKRLISLGQFGKNEVMQVGHACGVFNGRLVAAFGLNAKGDIGTHAVIDQENLLGHIA